jgi:hypothetical protein
MPATEESMSVNLSNRAVVVGALVLIPRLVAINARFPRSLARAAKLVTKVKSKFAGLCRRTATRSSATQILAGSTWNFQALFHDSPAGGAFLNTSNATSITFGP